MVAQQIGDMHEVDGFAVRRLDIVVRKSEPTNRRCENVFGAVAVVGCTAAIRFSPIFEISASGDESENGGQWRLFDDQGIA